MVGLRAESGDALPGLCSQPQEGTGNAQTAGDSLDSCQRGDSRSAPRAILLTRSDLSAHTSAIRLKEIPRVVGHGEGGGEVALAQGPNEGGVGQKAVRHLSG